MGRQGVSVEDATEDYDVMSADVDDNGPEDDGHDWNANELMRGDDEKEAEPLDDDDQEPGPDDEDAKEPEEDDEEELELSEEDDEEGEVKDEEGSEEVAPIDPPANWPQQEQEFFRKLPPALQHAYLARARHMTADYTRKTQELSQVRQHYAELDRTIGPHVQKWALNGMAPAQAVQQLIALSDFATQDPAQFIQYFANLRGVDLNSLTQQKENEYVDPQVMALRQQLAGVQAHLNQTAQAQQMAFQQQQEMAQRQAFAVTNSAIDNFASQIGPDRKPLYPYFNELEEDMAAEIETGRAKTIHEAYERAKWANPFTRSKLLARSRQEQNAKARGQTREARRAASSISGSSSAYGTPSTDSMSIRDLLHASYDGAI